MAAEETIVLDISSDEEVGWGGSMASSGGACSGGGGGGGGGVRDDGDWISELLGEVNKETDDSDDVVVVDAVIAKPPKLRVSKCLVKCVNKIDGGEDDDECVVLDGDPDKPVAIENDKEEYDSDELLVVSEKGQVACRDYPHARHLCVKFPFSSTPHDRHCDQCHCYVCDSLAPCLHWSTSFSNSDHCHATDKDEFWKDQRKSSKKSDKAPPIAPGVPDTSFSTGLAPPLPSNPSLQNPLLLTQAAHQLSTTATSNGTPNILTHVRSQQSGNYMRNKYEPHFVSPQLRSVTPGDKRHNVGNTGIHSVARVPFKRSGTVGGILPTNNRFSNNPSRISHGHQFPSSHPSAARWLDPSGGVTPVMNTYQDSSAATVGGVPSSLMSNLPAMTNMVNGTVNHAPSQPQIFPQTRGSSVNTSAMGPQYQFSSRMFANSNFASPMLVQPRVATQPYPFPFQIQATSYPNDASISQHPVPSEPLVTSWGNMSNCFESAISTEPNADSGFENPLHRPQVGSQPTSFPDHGTDTFQHGNQTQTTIGPSSAEFGFSSDSSMSQGKHLPVENNLLENSVQRVEPAVNMDGGSELLGSNNGSPLDFLYDSWIFEEQSALDALGIPVPPELNRFSPEAVPIDAGVFFDL